MEDFDLSEQTDVFHDLPVSATVGMTSADESTSFDLNESSANIDDSMDQSTSRSLRTSRRRVQKGSAVVLNADRLRQIVHQEDHLEESKTEVASNGPVGNSNIPNDLPPDFKSRPKVLRSPTKPDNQLLPKFSPESQRVIQHFRKDMNAADAAKLICTWYKHRRAHRVARFTQHGQWAFSTAEKVHALLLGHKIRKLFRKNNEVKRLIASQKDIHRVLTELVYQDSTSPANVKRNGAKTLKELLQSSHLLSGPDQSLASSLTKELLLEREKLNKFMFQGRSFVSFPKPGYWELNVRANPTSTPSHSAQKRSLLMSPPRETNAQRQKAVQETPPHVRRAVEQPKVKVPVKLYVGQHNKQLIDDSLASIQELEILASASQDQQHQSHSAIKVRPKSLHNILDREETAVGNLYPSDERPAYIASSAKNHNTPPARSSAQSSTPLQNNASNNRKSLRVSSVGAGSSSSSRLSTSSARPPATAATAIERKRTQDGAHIQLEIISGERLIPAKKGASTKDSIPDRKPCLKVTLLLPTVTNVKASVNASTPGTLKKVFHTVRDFEEVTLNPTWNATFALTLPCPKTLLRSLLEADNLPGVSLQDVVGDALDDDGTDNDGFYALSDAQYELITKCLLQHWSGGQVLIEVVDGERFNEEIFMGQTLLLLSSFLPMIRKAHEMEIKGSFTLDKQLPTNRVSGSILLHAFLHVPEKNYVEEQLGGIVDQVRKQHAQVQIETAAAAVSMFKAKHNQSQQQQQNSHGFSLPAKIPLPGGAVSTVPVASARPSAPDDDKEDFGRPGPSTSNPYHSNSESERDVTTPTYQSAVRTPASASAQTSNKVRGVGESVNQRTPPSTETGTQSKSAADGDQAPVFASKFLQDLMASLNEEMKGYLPPHRTPQQPSQPTADHDDHWQALQYKAEHLFSPGYDKAPIGDPRLEESDNIQLPLQGRNHNNSHHSFPHHRNQHASPAPASVVVSMPEAYHVMRQNHGLLPAEMTTASSSSSSVQKAAARSGNLMGSNHSTPVRVTMSSIVSAESASESRRNTRLFLQHMSKQLDELSAVQHSAEEVVDSYGRLLLHSRQHDLEMHEQQRQQQQQHKHKSHASAERPKSLPGSSHRSLPSQRDNGHNTRRSTGVGAGVSPAVALFVHKATPLSAATGASVAAGTRSPASKATTGASRRAQQMSAATALLFEAEQSILEPSIGQTSLSAHIIGNEDEDETVDVIDVLDDVEADGDDEKVDEEDVEGDYNYNSYDDRDARHPLSSHSSPKHIPGASAFAASFYEEEDDDEEEDDHDAAFHRHHHATSQHPRHPSQHNRRHHKKNGADDDSYEFDDPFDSDDDDGKVVVGAETNGHDEEEEEEVEYLVRAEDVHPYDTLLNSSHVTHSPPRGKQVGSADRRRHYEEEEEDDGEDEIAVVKSSPEQQQLIAQTDDRRENDKNGSLFGGEVRRPSFLLRQPPPPPPPPPRPFPSAVSSDDPVPHVHHNTPDNAKRLSAVLAKVGQAISEVSLLTGSPSNHRPGSLHQMPPNKPPQPPPPPPRVPPSALPLSAAAINALNPVSSSSAVSRGSPSKIPTIKRSSSSGTGTPSQHSDSDRSPPHQPPPQEHYPAQGSSSRSSSRATSGGPIGLPSSMKGMKLSTHPGEVLAMDFSGVTLEDRRVRTGMSSPESIGAASGAGLQRKRSMRRTAAEGGAVDTSYDSGSAAGDGDGSGGAMSSPATQRMQERLLEQRKLQFAKR